MADIIHFPNALQKSRGKEILEPIVVQSSDTNKMLLGPWQFTCFKCKTKTSFESQNMIFKTIEFYCASCGSLHKVTNPAFTLPIKKK